MSLHKKLPTSRSIRVLRFAGRPLASDKIQATTETESNKECLDPVMHPVRCEISVISLADSGPFDALSYVWGDPSVREGRMICNSHQINITFNLWSALHQVWTNWPDKTLWVDALCINQDDIPERNQQVAMMGSIYRTAEYVIVWLGDPTQKSRSLFEVFENLKNGQSVITQPPTEAKTPGKDTVEPGQNVVASQSTSIGPLLYELFSRAWFSRVWTLQEIKLAQRAILCCGPLYHDFSILSQTIDKHNESEPMAHVCGMGYIGNPIIEVEENVTLFNLLVRTRERKATDPRDKIYSLLSLLPTDLYDFLGPDYSLSEEETIIWASRIFIDVDKDTACLSDAGLENMRDDTLPSWAVDWRGRDEYEHQGRQGFPGELRDNSRLLRARFEYNRNLDRVSRKLAIRGWAFGRLQVDEGNGSVFLTGFPDCALQAVEVPARDFQECHGLSPEQFFVFCKGIKRHDDEKCTCMDDASRVVYPKRNLPGKIREGDWLWRHAFNMEEKVDYVWDDSELDETVVGRGKIVNGLRAKRMNEGCDFILHPVSTDSEVNFQVVGEAWGYGIRGLTAPTRFSLSLRHPESSVVISSFVLV